MCRVLSFFLVSAIVSTASAQSISLSGTVKNKSGMPISGAAGDNTIGAGGGYGGFYCFALNP
ncbi:MAG: hypothetical protein JXA18_09895 [Chitinispirillaceae bacterium]|nr:hypothetical protein [Chitinispirillaceae bacterium]